MQGHLISNWFNSTAVYQEHSLLLEQICNFHNDFSHFMAHALQDMPRMSRCQRPPEVTQSAGIQNNFKLSDWS